MKQKDTKYLYIIPIIIGVIIFIDQFMLHGQLYEIADINNHETIGLVFLMFGVGAYSFKKRWFIK